MGYQKISKEDELKLVEEYRNGAPVSELMSRYGYKTKKSITDKVKKYYPNEYQNIIQQAQDNRRGYTYSLSEIKSPFDAYLIGLMLTDGYLLSDRDGIGLDMVDEDAIAFIAKGIGTTYKAYSQTGKQTRENLYRIETANQFNILKLIAIVYNKPFGMNRKYIEIRKTFRDYNKDFFIGNNEIDGIVQTATE